MQLGKPHDGPDDVSNILCLCPNHHAQFDYGGLRIELDLRATNRVTGSRVGTLREHPRHQINRDYLRYRLTMFP